MVMNLKPIRKYDCTSDYPYSDPLELYDSIWDKATMTMHKPLFNQLRRQLVVFDAGVIENRLKRVVYES